MISLILYLLLHLSSLFANMKLFDFISNILTYKKNTEIEISDYNNYSPFIINRYLSHYNDNICFIVNHTVNRINDINFNKDFHYKFLINILPKVKNKFINYIKRDKPKTENFSKCANLHEVSEREIELYFKNYGLNIKNYE